MAYGVQNELLKAYGEAAQQIAERHRRGGNRGAISTKERVKELRRRLNMSQAEFAQCLNIAFSTVKNWEQESRGEPNGLASTFIKMVEAEPDTMIRILKSIQLEDEYVDQKKLMENNNM